MIRFLSKVTATRPRDCEAMGAFNPSIDVIQALFRDQVIDQFGALEESKIVVGDHRQMNPRRIGPNGNALKIVMCARRCAQHLDLIGGAIRRHIEPPHTA